ncbi:50S ribosomal protein L24 [Hyphomonas sp. NPDC076900]|jgi:large subunit ribosomal protein L24|uniref:Large ribosomal subunit protein uL24 n=1 Tax=Hyphomonas polymorpha PS728 TaxID=1280954 RepID=A0A062VL07_9PROT|nr:MULTISPECIES: 50S ribosomal protein L24 [Hyphomonas]OYW88808.1 MAG: 50S ribosomal protein L24 [Hyphomonas sp. 32-62-5]AXE63167.1 50S ribosomal protein L24 [Hyphomonas sp. CACIAM 19H1]KDA00377.1 50S ribosomal protein L24 [Hyphomonas polymorpha PS728]MBA4228378.1 50S ribosomal protein L24 [Hyphomonas sp.]OZB17526.1 MAG: 50S ribosomal protein L24 [Hyphomonas sp. 34-62-18]
MAAKIKKGDTVIVIAGKDKGTKGEVLKVIPDESRVVVRGVNLVKRHQKPSQMDPGGLKTFEAPVHVSNVALADPRDGKAVRVGFKIDQHGRKTRFAKRSGESIDV